MFNEGAGQTRDLARGWHGYLVGTPAWYHGHGRPGVVLDFNGTNQYLWCDNAPTTFGAADFTIVAHVYNRGQTTGDALFSKDNGSAGGRSFSFILNLNAAQTVSAGRIRWQHWTASSTSAYALRESTAAGIVPVNTWVSVAVTRTNGVTALWYNGVVVASTLTLAGTGTDAGAIFNTSTIMEIGRRQFAAESWFDGKFDALRVYTRALTSSELRLLYDDPYAGIKSASALPQYYIKAPFVPLGARTRYVNTASTAGGDGTSNLTTGATRAFASLKEALIVEKALGADLIAHAGKLTIICEGTAADVEGTNDNNAQIDIDGWTTNSFYYIEIKTDTAARHDGKWNTGKYRLEYQWAPLRIRVNASYTVIDGLQIAVGSGNNDPNQAGVSVTAAATDVIVRNCIIKFLSSTGTSAGGIHGGTDAAGNRILSNNIIYDFNTSSSFGIKTVNHTAGRTYVLHCTIVDCTLGVVDGFGDVQIQNSIIQGGTTCVSGGLIDGGSGWFAASDATASGTGSIDNATVTFVNAAADDFHVSNTDTSGVLNGGLDLTAAFPLDIDGDTRTTTPTMGADEVTTVAPTAKAGTETLSITLTEAAAIASTTVVTDTVAVSFTEASALLAARTLADTVAVSMTDVVSSVALTIAPTDTVAVSFGEAVILGAALATTDTVAVSLADAASSLASTIAAADTVAVSITEAAGLGATAVLADTLAVSTTDAVAGLVVASVPADAADVSFGEVVAASVTVVGADTLAVGLAEASELGVQITVEDAVDASLTEEWAAAIAAVIADDLDAILVEFSYSALASVGADAVDASLAEVVEAVISVTAADAVVVSFAEAVSSALHIALADELGPVIDEAVQSAIFSALTDTADVELSDAAAGGFSQAVSDSLSLSLSETSSIFSDIYPVAASDSIAVSVTESSNVSGTIVTGDTLSAVLVEARQLAVVSAASDAADVLLDEVLGRDAGLTAADAAHVSIDEAAALLIHLAVVDAVDVVAVDAVAELFSGLNLSDVAVVSLAELLTAEVASACSDDVVVVISDEVTSFLAELVLADVLTLTLLDASVILQQGYVPPPVSRWVTIPADDGRLMTVAAAERTMTVQPDVRELDAENVEREMVISAEPRTLQTTG